MNLGYEYMGIVQINADDVVKIQKKLIEIPQVTSIYDVTGDSDCIVIISCLDREDFSKTVKNINSLEGVNKTNTSVVLNIIKDPSEFVPRLFDDETK